MNILLVEDEVIPAMDLKKRLSDYGYTVSGHAVTGEQAVSLAESLDVDLILMDIKLKGDMDGVEAARIIREKAEVPIIFLTAYSDKNTLQRSMSIAPHGYVLKPVNDRDLFATLESALVRNRLEKDLRRRISLENVFARVASLAAAADSLDEFLAESLEVFGETLSVSRSYFLAVDRKKKEIINSHEWCAPGIPSVMDIVNGQPAREGAYFYDRMFLGEYLALSDTELLEDPEARDTLRRQDIKALLLFPILSGKELLGIIGFDECRSPRDWQPDELRALETMVHLAKGLFLRIRSEAGIRRQLVLNNMLSDFTGKLIDALPNQMDRVVQEALEAAGNYFHAERAYVSCFLEEGRFYNNTHEWCAEGIEPQKDFLQHVDTHTLSYFYNRLMKNEIFVFEDVDDLPDNARAEKESFKRQSIRSIIIYPAFIRGVLRGFIGFDSVRKKRSWRSVDRSWLTLFSRLCILGALSPRDEERLLIDGGKNDS
ncbi:MAG: response regulator [Spirochaetales bacterium]|nr:response regulator [Spirochaetales bacterium]